MAMKRAVNSQGQEVNLPAKPERSEFQSDEDWEEAVSGWNHRVLPLLALERTMANRSSALSDKTQAPASDK